MTRLTPAQIDAADVPQIVKDRAKRGSESDRFVIAHKLRYPTLADRTQAVQAWLSRTARERDGRAREGE